MDISQQSLTGISGGPSKTHPADKEIQHICDKVKSQVEEKAGKKFEHYTAVSFRSQVVSGTNYFIKVNVGGQHCVHLRVIKQLACNGGAIELTGIQQPKSQKDPIEYF